MDKWVQNGGILSNLFGVCRVGKASLIVHIVCSYVYSLCGMISVLKLIRHRCFVCLFIEKLRTEVYHSPSEIAQQ